MVNRCTRMLRQLRDLTLRRFPSEYYKTKWTYVERFLCLRALAVEYWRLYLSVRFEIQDNTRWQMSLSLQ